MSPKHAENKNMSRDHEAGHGGHGHREHVHGGHGHGREKPLVKKWIPVGIAALTMGVMWLVAPSYASNWFGHSSDYLKEMIMILPAVFVLTGLLETWVPRTTVEKYLGHESGTRGVVISILLGSCMEGPLYAAFPIASSMLRKGVRLRNAIVFLGAWAAAKVTMVAFEAKFLGIDFALLRLGLTIPTIILIGTLVEKFATPGPNEAVPWSRTAAAQEPQD